MIRIEFSTVQEPLPSYTTSLYGTDYVTERDNLNSFQFPTLGVNISIEYENLNQIGQKILRVRFTQ